MNLKILLPFRVLAELRDVMRIVVETPQGFFGLLPQRRDCVAALVPGILTYQAAGAGEVFVAVDEGVLIKTGDQVFVSVRQAISGDDLGQLRNAVRTEFLTLDKRDRDVRAVMARLETGFVHRLASFHHE